MQAGVVVVYCLAVGAFCVAFALLNPVTTARGIIAIAGRAIAIVRDSALDDRAKELETQALSLAMLRGFAAISFKGVLLVAAAALPAALASALGLVALEPVLAFSLRWDVALVTLLAQTAAAFVLRRQRLPERQ